VDNAHAHIAQLVLLAVVHVDVRKADVGGFVIKDRRAASSREVARAGKMVGLDMGLALLGANVVCANASPPVVLRSNRVFLSPR
jgi:hypothetical protein